MSGFITQNTVGSDWETRGGTPSPPPPFTPYRWPGGIQELDLSGSDYDVQLTDNGKLLVITNTHNQGGVLNLPDATSYPIGFSFGVVTRDGSNKQGMTIALQSGHFYDDTGDMTNAINPATPGLGPYAFFIEVTRINGPGGNDFQVSAICGSWTLS